MVRDTLPTLAVSVAVVWPITASVGAENVAELCPARTVTLAGDDTDGELSARATLVPPLGARPSSETVPEIVWPPVMAAGATVMAETTGGTTVNEPVRVRPRAVAVSVTT